VSADDAGTETVRGRIRRSDGYRWIFGNLEIGLPDLGHWLTLRRRGAASGGRIDLERGVSGNTLASDVRIALEGNLLQIGETGGTQRGCHLDITALAAGFGTPLVGGVAIVRTAEVVTTSGTVIDWTGLPSDVHEIVIKARGISQSATDAFLVQLGTSGGFETTGYTSTSQLSGTSVNSTSGFIVLENSAGNIQSFTMCIRRVGSTNLWVADGSQVIRTVTGAGGVLTGEKTLAGVLTQVRLRLTGSANFDAGAVSLDYVRAA
jgi:hypothetical protein